MVALLACGLAVWAGHARSEPAALAGANVQHQAAATRTAAVTVAQTPEAALPTRWLPGHGRECARSGRGKGYCQGPRKVPLPHGAEADLAARLGLGTRDVAGDLLVDAPKPEWTEAAGPDRREALLWPVDEGEVWRGLQQKRSRKNKRGPRHSHKGVDIGAPEGSLIRAVKSGLVAYSDNGVRGYGNLLVTLHPDGSVAVYGHCRAIYVFPGQHVARGQIVGEVGHTGVARGSHLHFEYREHGKLRDPLPRFASRPGE